MATVKVPDSLRSDLAAMDLTIWIAQHPIVGGYDVGGVKGRGRADTSRVRVQLTGPGLSEHSPWGYGRDLQTAVDDALRHRLIIDRVKGLKGAMLRLEGAVSGLSKVVMYERLYTEQPGYDRSRAFGLSLDDRDHDVPF